MTTPATWILRTGEISSPLSRIYHNNGNGTFTDVARRLGIDKPVMSFPTWWWDYDNDGELDLFVASFVPSVTEVVRRYAGLRSGRRVRRSAGVQWCVAAAFAGQQGRGELCAPAGDGCAATGSAAAVVGVDRRLLDGAGWTAVQDAPFARVTSGNQPKYRAAVAFTSSDGRLVVDVSSYEVMSLETADWPIDEYMYFLEGEVEIRDAAGQGGVYGPGDSITTPKGWTGT